MKRILIPFTVMHTPLNALAFAAKISKEQSVPIHGIFLKEAPESIGFRYPFPNDFPLTEEKLSSENIAAENSRIMDDKIKLFKDECEAEGIAYKIEKDISINQFIDETSDADLMVTDTRAVFLEDVLPHSNCPAYIVSESELPGKIVLLYDGSDSSRHAVKMYTSFYPEWLSLPTSVVSINLSEKEQKEIESFIKKGLQPQLKNFRIQSLHGNKEKELIAFLEQQDNGTLVVMGAFGRSAISRFFHESLANAVIENTRCSLFIAH